jgi:adenosylcobyric acid synthase
MTKLYVVGIGPGDLAHLTPAASAAIADATVVVGYSPYLDLIAPLLAGKELVSSGMMREVERCRAALERAAGGSITALVSSGDAGIYGMAGLALELSGEFPQPPEIEVIPGISAVQAAAAVLGAPLMHDFAVISLSDLLTPWETIRQRLVAAASADFVVALYNPKSKGRVTQIEEARRILLTSRPGATPVGIVRNALRPGQERIVTTLDDLLHHEIDMFSLVLIGNQTTYVDAAGRMVTPRGYSSGTRNEERGTTLKSSNLDPRTSILVPRSSPQPRHHALRYRVGRGEIGADRRHLPAAAEPGPPGRPLQVPEHGPQFGRHPRGGGDWPGPGGAGRGMPYPAPYGYEPDPSETDL